MASRTDHVIDIWLAMLQAIMTSTTRTGSSDRRNRNAPQMAEKAKPGMLPMKADSRIAAIIGRSPCPRLAASAMQGGIAAAATIHDAGQVLPMMAPRPA